MDTCDFHTQPVCIARIEQKMKLAVSTDGINLDVTLHDDMKTGTATEGNGTLYSLSCAYM